MKTNKKNKNMNEIKTEILLNRAIEVFETESKQINNLKHYITEDFALAIRAIIESKGKLIVIGMGKSGIIGKKIAATLASTGTPSFFLHPGEAYHGDLGMIEPKDVVLLISNSGETDEVLKIIPFLKSQGNITISIAKNKKSTLAKNTNLFLNINTDQEGCPLNLAPMSSTTATLVMGDALAAVLMTERGFKDEDFARFHPGGSLGKKLLMTAKDIMHKKLPIITNQDENMKNIIHKISDYGLGLCIISNENRDIIGLITDGDIRRCMEENEENFFKLTVKEIMNTSPTIIKQDVKLVEINEIMQKNKIQSLIVEHNHVLKGIVQIFDI